MEEKPTTSINTTTRRLIPGLHVAIVTNPLEGYGGSLFAWEAYQACRHSGLSAILATFAQGRRYPDIGPDLRRLPVPDADSSGQSAVENLACLLPIVKEAEAGNRFLIIDTKTGFSLRDPMFEVLDYCGVSHATSIAALIPIQQDPPSIFCAALACEAFQSIGISFTRGLFRTWGLHTGFAPLGLLNIPLIESWVPKYLSQGALASIRNSGQIVEAPPDLFPTVIGSRKGSDLLKPSEEVRLHVLSASRVIHSAILAPICESLPR
jgi:hypothetical protein